MSRARALQNLGLSHLSEPDLDKELRKRLRKRHVEGMDLNRRRGDKVDEEYHRKKIKELDQEQ